MNAILMQKNKIGKIVSMKLIKMEEEVSEEAFLPKGCDCANGIHDGKRVDCACNLCHN